MVGRPTLGESRGWICGEPPLQVRAMSVLNELAEWMKKLPVTKRRDKGPREGCGCWDGAGVVGSVFSTRRCPFLR